jgi:hypothetical protein
LLPLKHSEWEFDAQQSIGVSGWLDLGEGWQPYLSTTKDAIDDAPLYGALMDHVFKSIKPLLQAAERKSFSVRFDDLAIGLEQALNSRAGDVVVKVATEMRPPPISDNPTDEPPTDHPPGPAPDRNKENNAAVIAYDLNCTGKVNANYIVPDLKTDAIVLTLDRNGDGKPDVIFFDFKRRDIMGPLFLGRKI